MKKEYQDRIDDYLLNRMTEEQRKAFEEELRMDEELRDQLLFTQAVQRIERSRNEKLDAMNKWRDDYAWRDGEKADVRVRNMKRILCWVSSIAALLLAGFFIFQVIHSDDENSPNEIGKSIFRGGFDNADIEQLIENGDFEAALEIIDKKSESICADTCELALKPNVDDEVRDYDMQIAKDRLDELKWLRIRVLIDLERQDEASTLLNELRSVEGPYQAEADSLYILLKKN